MKDDPIPNELDTEVARLTQQTTAATREMTKFMEALRESNKEAAGIGEQMKVSRGAVNGLSEELRRTRGELDQGVRQPLQKLATEVAAAGEEATGLDNRVENLQGVTELVDTNLRTLSHRADTATDAVDQLNVTGRLVGEVEEKVQALFAGLKRAGSSIFGQAKTSQLAWEAAAASSEGVMADVEGFGSHIKQASTTLTNTVERARDRVNADVEDLGRQSGEVSDLAGQFANRVQDGLAGVTRVSESAAKLEHGTTQIREQVDNARRNMETISTELSEVGTAFRAAENKAVQAVGALDRVGNSAASATQELNREVEHLKRVMKALGGVTQTLTGTTRGLGRRFGFFWRRPTKRSK